MNSGSWNPYFLKLPSLRSIVLSVSLWVCILSAAFSYLSSNNVPSPRLQLRSIASFLPECCVHHCVLLLQSEIFQREFFFPAARGSLGRYQMDGNLTLSVAGWKTASKAYFGASELWNETDHFPFTVRRNILYEFIPLICNIFLIWQIFGAITDHYTSWLITTFSNVLRSACLKKSEWK